MQVVMCYRRIDAALRETAGNFTLLEERISDTAIHRRLKACVPWVKTPLGRMMGEAFQPVTEGRLQFLMVDGSAVPAPGAKGTDYRLHIAMDWVRLHLIPVKGTDAHEGRSRAIRPPPVIVPATPEAAVGRNLRHHRMALLS